MIPCRGEACHIKKRLRGTMDKQGIAAISIAIAVLIGWQIYYAKSYRPPQTSAAPSGQTAADTASPPATAPPAAGASQKAAQALKTAAPAPVAQTVPESVQTVASTSVEYTFTNLGGGISRATLLKHMAEHGGKVVLNQHGSIPIGDVTERPGEGTNLPFTITTDAGEARQVTCDGFLANPKVRLVKTFTLPGATSGKDEYLVRLDLSYTNSGEEAYQSPGNYVYVGSAAPIHADDQPIYTGFDWRGPGKTKFTDVNWFSEGRIPLLGIQTSEEKSVYTDGAEHVWWAGVKNQYFTTIASAQERNGRGVWARRFEAPAEGSDAETKRFGIEGALGLPGFKLEPGATIQQQVHFYIGPKEYARLKELGNREDEIMNFGMFKIVSQFLLTAMNWLNAQLGNYAAAIFVLTIAIKTALWPLQNKATNSMKRMQALQPKMTELREKYKDDPTRMNQELMKLYKDYGINPVGGCLPMLFQIPIFFGFYSMLGSAVELRNSRFLWVDDLSQPDTVVNDLFGFVDINPLPLLMAVTMLWQMQITPKTGDAVQQRIFMFVPLIFIFFCYNFASALALYWTVQNLFSIVQLYLTRNQVAPILEKVAAAPAGKKKR